MKRVLVLCLHRPNRSPSQRFRFEQYLPHLEANGFEIDFSYLLDAHDDKIYYSRGNLLSKARIVIASTLKRFREMLQVSKYDLVFVQREGFMLGTDFFESRMAAKVPMIFDFDDSIWLHNVSDANKLFGFLKDASKTGKLIHSARLVFAGNQYLADYAAKFNPNLEIVPTTIDTDAYFVKEPEPDADRPVCVGWSGSFTTIEHFSVALPALTKLKEKYGDRVRFKVIGDGNYRYPELDIVGLPWKADTEVADLQEIDIGIMPLPHSEWAEGKCALKGLQYMALGIATAMSPVGVNSTVVEEGVNGFLPDTEQEWVETLSTLIEDSELRRRIGLAGRETVEEHYSIRAWQDRYLELFQKACS